MERQMPGPKPQPAPLGDAEGSDMLDDPEVDNSELDSE